MLFFTMTTVVIVLQAVAFFVMLWGMRAEMHRKIERG
jgi:nitrogen fixation-related uncharacterized protein